MKLLSTRLLTPGPTPIPDRVRLAMAEPKPADEKLKVQPADSEY